jgi:hypothetical protein
MLTGEHAYLILDGGGHPPPAHVTRLCGQSRDFLEQSSVVGGRQQGVADACLEVRLHTQAEFVCLSCESECHASRTVRASVASAPVVEPARYPQQARSSILVSDGRDAQEVYVSALPQGSGQDFDRSFLRLP